MGSLICQKSDSSRHRASDLPDDCHLALDKMPFVWWQSIGQLSHALIKKSSGATSALMSASGQGKIRIRFKTGFVLRPDYSAATDRKAHSIERKELCAQTFLCNTLI